MCIGNVPSSSGIITHPEIFLIFIGLCKKNLRNLFIDVSLNPEFKDGVMGRMLDVHFYYSLIELLQNLLTNMQTLRRVMQSLMQ